MNVLVNGTNRAVHLSFLPKIEPERKALCQGLIVGLYDHLLMVLLLHINSLVMMKSPHEGDHTSGPTIIRRGCGPAGPQSQMLLGDAINLATTVNLIAYTLVIGGQHYGHFDVLSPSFVLDGFCVSNKDESLYVQSHALCLYGRCGLRHTAVWNGHPGQEPSGCSSRCDDPSTALGVREAPRARVCDLPLLTPGQRALCTTSLCEPSDAHT